MANENMLVEMRYVKPGNHRMNMVYRQLQAEAPRQLRGYPPNRLRLRVRQLIKR